MKMEATDGLILRESFIQTLPPQQRTVHAFHWLNFLESVLPLTTKNEVAQVQSKLIEQLMSSICAGPGPPSRRLLVRCLSLVFHNGETQQLLHIVTRLSDLTKSREQPLNVRLASVACLGSLHEYLGRGIGRGFEDTCKMISREFGKHAEATQRAEILIAICGIINGTNGISRLQIMHREIYQKMIRTGLTDRAVIVRNAAADAISCLSCTPFASVLAGDLDSVISTCVKSLDWSATGETRHHIASAIGQLLIGCLDNTKSTLISQACGQSTQKVSAKQVLVRVEDCLCLLSSTFQRGAAGSSGLTGFLVSGKSRLDIASARIGVTYAYVEFVDQLNRIAWLVDPVGSSSLVTSSTNLAGSLIDAALSLAASLFSASQSNAATLTHGDCLLTRRCSLLVLWELSCRKLSSNQAPIVLSKLSECVTKFSNDSKLHAGVPESQDFQGVCSQLMTTFLATGLLVTSKSDTLGGDSSVADRASVEQAAVTALAHTSSTVRTAAAWYLQHTVFIDDFRFPAVHTLARSCISRVRCSLEPPSDGVPSVSSSELAGLCQCLSGLLSLSRVSELGLPNEMCFVVFDTGEALLRSAFSSDDANLCLARLPGGWLLLTACCLAFPCASLDTYLAQRSLNLCRSTLPKNPKELEKEKTNRDVSTWVASLAARAGSVDCLYALLKSQSHESIDKNWSKLKPLIDSAVFLVTQLSGIFKLLIEAQTSNAASSMAFKQLRSSGARLRLKLYKVICLISPYKLTAWMPALFREVITEFSLADAPANSATTTSVLPSILVKSFQPVVPDFEAMQDRDLDPACYLEQLLLLPHGHYGGLEHDTGSLLWQTKNIFTPAKTSLGEDVLDWCLPSPPHSIPLSLPLGVDVINAAVKVFGHIFPFANPKHQQQLCSHLLLVLKEFSHNPAGQTIDNGTVSPQLARYLAIGSNIFAALIYAFNQFDKNRFDENGARRVIADAETRTCIAQICLAIFGLKDFPETRLVRLSGVHLYGKLSTVVDDVSWPLQLSDTAFQGAKDSKREPWFRASCALALGAIHRFCPAIRSEAPNQLQDCVTFLTFLACPVQTSGPASMPLGTSPEATNSPLLQTWSILSLEQIVEWIDSGSSPILSAFLTESLLPALTNILLVTASPQHVQLTCSAGACLAGLVSHLGPELSIASTQMDSNRNMIQAGILAMSCHSSSRVRLHAVLTITQMHVFAPSSVRLDWLVKFLLTCLPPSSFVGTPFASIALSLITSFEAKVIHPSSYTPLRVGALACLRQLVQREPGEVLQQCALACGLGPSPVHGTGGHFLIFALFTLLDTECDPKCRAEITETLVSLMTGLSQDHDENKETKRWIGVLGRILSSGGSNPVAAKSSPAQPDLAECDIEDGDDTTTFTAHDDEEADKGRTATNQPNATSTTKKRQMQFSWRARHFAMAMLNKLVSSSTPVCPPASECSQSSVLLPFISELMRLGFVSATWPGCPHTRLGGLRLLRSLVIAFTGVPDPDLPGQSALEQYQAQVGAALRPAFAPEASPLLTSAACDVCSVWLATGLAHDLSDVKRVAQLLTTSLDKIASNSKSTTLSVEAKPGEVAGLTQTLAVLKAWAEVYTACKQASVVNLGQLCPLWADCLKDYAVLSLADAGTKRRKLLLTSSTAPQLKELYDGVWPRVLLAFTLAQQVHDDISSKHDNIFLIRGMALQNICQRVTEKDPMVIEACIDSLLALENLVTNNCVKDELDAEENVSNDRDCVVSLEIINVSYRLLLMRRLTQSCHSKVILLIGRILDEWPCISAPSTPTEPNTSDTPTSHTQAVVCLVLEVCLHLLPSCDDSRPSSGRCFLVEPLLNLAFRLPKLCGLTHPSLAHQSFSLSCHLVTHRAIAPVFCGQNVDASKSAQSAILRALKVFVSMSHIPLSLREPSGIPALSTLPTFRAVLASALVDMLAFPDFDNDRKPDLAAVLMLSCTPELLAASPNSALPSKLAALICQQIWPTAKSSTKLILLSAAETFLQKARTVSNPSLVVQSPATNQLFLHDIGCQATKTLADLLNASRRLDDADERYITACFGFLTEIVRFAQVRAKAKSSSHRNSFESLFTLQFGLFMKCMEHPVFSANKSSPFSSGILRAVLELASLDQNLMKHILAANPAWKEQFRLAATKPVVASTSTNGNPPADSQTPAISLKMDFSHFTKN